MLDGRGEIKTINQSISFRLNLSYKGGMVVSKTSVTSVGTLDAGGGYSLAWAKVRVSTLSSLPAQDEFCQYHNGTSRDWG